MDASIARPKTGKWRRPLVTALIAIGLIMVFQFLVLSATLGKMFGFGGPFDAWAGSIARTL